MLQRSTPKVTADMIGNAPCFEHLHRGHASEISGEQDWRRDFRPRRTVHSCANEQKQPDAIATFPHAFSTWRTRMTIVTPSKSRNRTTTPLATPRSTAGPLDLTRLGPMCARSLV